MKKKPKRERPWPVHLEEWPHSKAQTLLEAKREANIAALLAAIDDADFERRRVFGISGGPHLSLWKSIVKLRNALR